jgi:hypothetical protein
MSPLVSNPFDVKTVSFCMPAQQHHSTVMDLVSCRSRNTRPSIANDADLRMMAPRVKKPIPEAVERTITVATTIQPSTDLMPGMMLRRDYKGRAVTELVLADGFEFEGERYKSLTAITQIVTGKHLNGFHFFGLRKKAGAQ